MIAATDSAVADLVFWLAEHPTVTEQIKQIGDKLGDEVLRELDKSYHSDQRASRRRALANHFWCDLLAAFAYALAELKSPLDGIPAAVSKMINAARDRHGKRRTIDDTEVRLAVDEAWGQFQQVPFIKTARELVDVSDPLTAIQILAVLICPAPEDHEEVIHYGLHPLLNDHIDKVTKHRIEEAIPDDWLQ